MTPKSPKFAQRSPAAVSRPQRRSFVRQPPRDAGRSVSGPRFASRRERTCPGRQPDASLSIHAQRWEAFVEDQPPLALPVHLTLGGASEGWLLGRPRSHGLGLGGGG